MGGYPRMGYSLARDGVPLCPDLDGGTTARSRQGGYLGQGTPCPGMGYPHQGLDRGYPGMGYPPARDGVPQNRVPPSN